MKEVQATTFDEIVEEFSKHPKQELLPSDMAYKLRFGWEIKNPPVRVVIRLAHVHQWTAELLDMCRDEAGRERMRKLIESKAWPE